MTLEEKKEQVKKFRPIDDTFFEVLEKSVTWKCSVLTRITI